MSKGKLYKLEPEIPEEIYLDVVVPDFFKDDIRKLSSAMDMKPKDIPYLGDIFFSLVASGFHYQNFVGFHNQLSKFIEEKTSEMLEKREDIGKGKAELVLGKAVPFIHFLFPLDSFITCVKRTLDFSMRFTINLLLNRKPKYVSIHRLSECFVKRTKKLNDINGEFEKNFPEFRLKFLEEWDKWMKDLNEIRDNVLHFFALKEGVFDVRFFRDGKKDRVSIEFVTKGMKKPREFLESTLKDFQEYFVWIVRYNLEQILETN